MSVHDYLVSGTGITTSRPGTSRRAGTTAVLAVVCPAIGAVAAGEPFSDLLAGPSSAAWGRRPGDYGRIADVTTDGGPVAPRPTASSAHPG